ncbi:multidrug resistance regulator 1 [[Candida] jaroonii]|uniref:Multidrug resistance regulator 1 n=1 Tax=[Candida] jaroonii TaxID=467808 RepID=A0ACA9Y453_9ASCO|nr:multidrug resistance regulator 1 [[Candida] jaroonii]
MTEPTRKRNRLSLSCNYCKRRKVKCDRGRPCSSCVKYNVGNLCEYSLFKSDDDTTKSDKPGLQPTFAVKQVDNNSGVLNELEMLKVRIKQLESSVGGEKSNTAKDQDQENGSSGPPNLSSSGRFSFQTPTLFQPGVPNTSYKNDFSSPSAIGSTPALTPNFPSIQLPPINPIPEIDNSYTTSKLPPFISPSPNTSDSLSDSRSFVLPPSYYSINQKRAYLAVNPCDNDDDIVNFYKDFDPCYIKDLSFRQNNGIFSWLTFIRKDSGLTRIWNHLINTTKGEKERKFKGTSGTGASAMAESIIAQTKDANDINNIITTEKILTSTFKDKILGIKPEEENEMESRFRERTIKSSDPADFKPYKEMDTPGSDSTISDRKYVSPTNTSLQTSPTYNTLSLGLTTVASKISLELELADKIILLLPPKKVIWTLINRFFTTIYPFMPFFDEISFKLEVTRILGPEDLDDTKIARLNVEKRLDFAYIGIMLLMLRFSYLALFSNKREVNEFNLKNPSADVKATQLRYLLSNPISIQVVEAAQICLNQFDLFRKTAFPVLQLMFTLRLYHIFGPEEGESTDGISHQINNGIIVQTAINMAINREPDLIDREHTNEKFNNMNRKLWFFIVNTDLIQGYQNGDPLAIDPKYFDTRLPFYKKGNENIADVELEKQMISTFSYFEKFYPKLKEILDISLNVNSDTPIKKFCDLISDFERFIYSNYGSLEHYMVPFSKEYFPYPFMKTMKCKTFLNLNNFVVTIFVHLYYIFEAKNHFKLSIYYFKKVLVFGCLNTTPYFIELFSRNHINFGEGSDLILNPSFIQSIHRVSQINISCLVKINATVHYYKKSPEHEANLKNDIYQEKFRKYCQLSLSITKNVKFVISVLSKLSNRYYYAWRITKAHRFLLNLVNGNEYYDSTNNEDLIRFVTNITPEDLDELIEIYDQTAQAIDERKFKLEKEFASESHPTPQPQDTERNKDGKLMFTFPANSPLNEGNFKGDPPSVQRSQTSDDFESVDIKEIDNFWSQLNNDTIFNELQDNDTLQQPNLTDDIFNAVDNYMDFVNYFKS